MRFPAGGSDWQTLHVLDVRPVRNLPDTVHWVKFSGISWTHDDKGFFYSRYPQPPEGEKEISQRSSIRSSITTGSGMPQSADRLIYARPDLPHASLRGGVSEDGRYLYRVRWKTARSRTTSCTTPIWACRTILIWPRRSCRCTRATMRRTAPIGAYRRHVVSAERRWMRRGDVSSRRVLAIRTPRTGGWWCPKAERRARRGDLADGRILANSGIDAKSRLKLFATGGKLLKTWIADPGHGRRHVGARRFATAYYAFTSYLYPDHGLPVRRRQRQDFGVLQAGREVRSVAVRNQAGLLSLKGWHPSVPMFIVARKGIKLDGSHPDGPVRLRRLRHHDHPELQSDAAGMAASWAAYTPSPTCAAAAPTARPGTRPACWATSRTCSTISPGPRNT